MKNLNSCLLVALGVTRVLIAGEVENKVLTDHIIKVKTAAAKMQDVQKGVAALNDQYAKLQQQGADLQRQQVALQDQIKTTNNSLGAVDQLVTQTQKSMEDAHTAAQNAILAAQNSQASTAETLQAKSHGTALASSMKSNADASAKIKSALDALKKKAIDTQSTLSKVVPIGS